MNDLLEETIELNTILWVKTISTPCIVAGVMLIVEDCNGDVLSLSLYNQIQNNLDFP